MLGLNLSESRVLREEAEKGEARGRQQGERSLPLLTHCRLATIAPLDWRGAIAPSSASARLHR
jgi:predicted transposase YdaD